MSMHILGPYMTTTKYNSKNKSTKNKRLLEARERHEKWLEENGYNKKPTKSVHSIPDYRQNRSSIPLSNSICNNGTSKERKEYTGTLIKGIAVSHKSNLQPVTSQEQMIDFANMRRN